MCSVGGVDALFHIALEFKMNSERMLLGSFYVCVGVINSL